MRIDWVKINKIVDETSDIKTFYLDLPEDFTWEEGDIVGNTRPYLGGEFNGN